MKATDIIGFYLQNPPFEITDIAKYTEMLKFVSDHTLIEISENDAMLDETVFTTDVAVEEGDTTVIFDLDTIDENFMEAVALEPTDTFATSVEFACSATGIWNTSQSVGASALQTAMNSGSVIGYLSVKDSMYIVEEWYSTKVRKMIYRGSEIKLVPEIEYYMLYRKYKTLTDLRMADMRTFKELFEINLQLQIYQSDTFAAEGGLKSVSLSGLSVSFNVPDASSVVGRLRTTKAKILSKMALDYEDMIGII
ncbi:MAG: hypothetical protein DRN30_06250 [Thermoplasmata archaeon]|nr:MAG: hypothetical protein DRN30_06250 [Thermoplasmata archaeon]